MNMPGVKKEDVKAELKDGYLTVSAETNTKKDEKAEDGKYIRRERYSGSCKEKLLCRRRCQTGRHQSQI